MYLIKVIALSMKIETKIPRKSKKSSNHIKPKISENVECINSYLSQNPKSSYDNRKK